MTKTTTILNFLKVQMARKVITIGGKKITVGHIVVTSAGITGIIGTAAFVYYQIIPNLSVVPRVRKIIVSPAIATAEMLKNKVTPTLVENTAIKGRTILLQQCLCKVSLIQHMNYLYALDPLEYQKIVLCTERILRNIRANPRSISDAGKLANQAVIDMIIVYKISKQAI